MLHKIIALFSILLGLCMEYAFGQSLLQRLSISTGITHTQYRRDVGRDVSGLELRLSYDISRGVAVFASYDRGMRSATQTRKSDANLFFPFVNVVSYQWQFDRASAGFQFNCFNKPGIPVKFYLRSGLSYLAPDIVNAKLTRSSQPYSSDPATSFYSVIGTRNVVGQDRIEARDYLLFSNREFTLKDGEADESKIVAADLGLGFAYAFNRFSIFVETNSQMPLSTKKLEGTIEPAGSVDVYNRFLNAGYARQQSFEAADRLPHALRVTVGCSIRLASQ